MPGIDFRWRAAKFAGAMLVLRATTALATPTLPSSLSSIGTFGYNDLVISTVTSQSTVGALDTAAPIVLYDLSLNAGGTSATAVGTLTLPQVASGANWAISGEYGSASEGMLQLSGNKGYLTIMGYGINAATFNGNPTAYTTGGSTALGQTTSSSTPRVVALISQRGAVDTTTALTNVFNTNNPRSATTVDGTSFYVAGQGVTGDGTGGVFYATKGATTATAINANTATPSGSPNGTASAAYGTEARAVELINNGSGYQLYVSRDFGAKGSPNDTTDIRTLANASGGLPTTSSGLVANRVLITSNSTGGNTSSIDITNATDNGVNHARNGQAPGHTGNTFVYLSPEQFWFANASTLYVADSGAPKNGSNAAGLGEGGLQKWVNSKADGSGVWTLAYDMVNGLSLVAQSTAGSDPTAAGVTGLYGLTGQVVGNQVQLFATSYGLNELSASYLYEITDSLANTDYTVGDAETFNVLYQAAAGTLIRGVSFAPVPEPASLTLIGIGFGGIVLSRRRHPKRSGTTRCRLGTFS